MRFIIGCMLCLCLIQNSYAADKLPTHKEDWAYVISNNDNLWNIASKFLKKIDYYTELQKINNIKYPKRLNPGTVIRIPMQWLKHSPATAQISFKQGESQFLHNNKLFPLNLTTKLVLGDEIRIGENASATVIFADGSEMVLFKNTIVSFDHLSVYGKTGMVDTRVRVIQGKVETTARKNKGPGSRLDISTPSAISSVRGTKYRVSNNINNISTVEVIEGNVAVVGDKPEKEVNVSQGLGTMIEKGKAPIKPVKLLSPPLITTHKKIFEKKPIIRWNKVKNASKYNVQISKEKNFKSILWQKIDKKNNVTIPISNTDDLYYFRVTAIDKLGIEGIPAYTQFSLNAFPSAPLLTDTPERFSETPELAYLSWLPHEDKNVNGYIIEIAEDEEFTKVLLKESTKNSHLTLPTSLTYGNYFWRVSATINLDKGPSSAPFSFVWKTQLKQPNCLINNTSTNINISWSSIENNQNIVIQTAANSQFNNNLKEYTFSATTTNFQIPKNDELFLRCRVVLSESNIVSKWSDTQHVSEIDKGIMSIFAILLLIILI